MGFWIFGFPNSDNSRLRRGCISGIIVLILWVGPVLEVRVFYPDDPGGNGDTAAHIEQPLKLNHDWPGNVPGGATLPLPPLA